jgi:hypothetical protein
VLATAERWRSAEVATKPVAVGGRPENGGMTGVNEEVALREFAAALVTALRGHGQFSLPPRAWPLAAVVLTRDGWWRDPHPLVTARRFLGRAIDAFESTAPRMRPERRQTVAKVVRLVWGVDGHPLSVAEALHRLQLQPSRSAERWPFQVAADPAVQSFVAAACAKARPPKDGLRPAGGGVRLDRLPPASAIARAQQLLDFERPMQAAVIPDADRGVLVVETLREVAARRVAEWFGDGTDFVCEGHLRWFQIEAARAWFTHGREPVLTPPAGITRPTGRSYAASVQAAWTVCMYEAADRTEQLQDCLDRRLDPLVAPQALPSWSSIWERLAQEQALLHITDHPTLLRLPPGARLPIARRIDPGWLVDLADWSRSWAGTDSQIARSAIVQYLRDRPAILLRARGDHEHVPIALSDHSVHWDTIVMGDHQLERQVRLALRDDPAYARWGYLTHTWRAPALLLNKRNDWTGAAYYARKGLVELVSWFDDDYVRDRAEFLGAAEQLWLAMAGINLRKIEWLLSRTQSDVPPPLMAKWCRDALVASGYALGCLTALDHTDELTPGLGEGLPASRHQDGRIDSKAWWPRALIVRLRVLLGVKTAIGSGLAKEGDVFADMARVDRSAPLITPALTPHDRSSLDVAYIRELYRTLCRLQTLSAAHHHELATIAMWLALFDDQSVPVDPDSSPTLAAGPTFLLPEDATQHRRPFDVDAFVRWLAREHERQLDPAVAPGDAWVLSWLDRRVAAAQHLDRSSGTMFRHFRRSHDLLRPPLPSHD